jgi:MerR family transcriptional regulator, copper efflux regulator
VSTAYRIAEVARRSGFSAATLRYYEGIGLLPEPARTEAGYRLYDEHALDRLAFIARAKQLGCSLEDIADLSTAWDGGRCGPVQDRLRTIVAAKRAEANARIVELTTLTAELRRAAVALEQHRPDGPCDERCGCTSDPARSIRVALVGKPDTGSEAPPIACTLGADSMGERLDRWETLLARTERRAAIDGGVRLEFAAGLSIGELAELTAAEQDCCRFFSFAVTIDGRGIGLEVRAPRDALPMVHALFGEPA